jgi:hypothetical protein
MLHRIENVNGGRDLDLKEKNVRGRRRRRDPKV